MSSLRHARVEQIFAAALSLEGDARDAYLQAECDDAALRADVQSLLAACEQSESYFDRLSNRLGVAAFFEPKTEQDEYRAGERIGAYELTERLAAGGMGSVWRGERRDGRFEGQVAIKFLHIHGGIAAARRFELEGSYLAKLTHPNIARLLDAGINAAGRPYLVMEYVDGLAIDKYAERERLTVAARISLFLDVLSAVQHAHANLIVHRDIKPSNVLVSSTGVAKLLDFGIAKLLQDDETTHPNFTTREFGVVLTPEYAAPEQLLGQPITTATDVYSLGLLLYKLLTGRHARDGETASTQPLRFTETEARKPSDAATDARTLSNDELTSIAAARRTTPNALRKILRGDLDNIVGKALALDPAARYTAVADFAEDLRRYLSNEPVTALPHTLSYRAAKFVRRHRGGVIGTALTMVALISAASVAAWQTHVAEKQRNRAIVLADRNVAINEFLNTVITDVTRTGAPISTKQMLERSELIAKRELSFRPDVLAGVMQLIASNYRNLGEFGKAETMLKETLAGMDKSTDPSLRADVQCEYGMVLSRQVGVDAGREMIHTALKVPDLDPLITANCLQFLGFIAQDVNDAQEALEYAQRARTVAQSSPSFSPGLDAGMLADVAYAYYMLRNLEEADRTYTTVLDMYKRMSLDRSPNTLSIRSNASFVDLAGGNPLKALEQYDLILEILAADDPTAKPPPHFLANRAFSLAESGRYMEARQQYDSALAVARDLHNDRWIAFCLVNLADLNREAGDLTAAERYLSEVRALNGAGMPKGSSAWARYTRTRGRVALARGRLDEARAAFDEEVAYDKARLTSNLLTGYAGLEMASGHLDAALNFARDALKDAQSHQVHGGYSCHTATSWLTLGRIFLQQGDRRQAHEAFQNAALHYRNTVDPKHSAAIEAEKLVKETAQ